MRVNLEHSAGTPQDQEEPNLSRRSFLTRLTILGVGCAAAMTLGVREADATTGADATDKAKDLADDEALAEGKKAKSSPASIQKTNWSSLLKRAGCTSGGAPDRTPGAPDGTPGAQDDTPGDTPGGPPYC